MNLLKCNDEILALLGWELRESGRESLLVYALHLSVGLAAKLRQGYPYDPAIAGISIPLHTSGANQFVYDGCRGGYGYTNQPRDVSHLLWAFDVQDVKNPPLGPGHFIERPVAGRRKEYLTHNLQEDIVQGFDVADINFHKGTVTK